MGADFEDDPLLGKAGLTFQTPVRPKRTKAHGKRSMRLSGAQIRRIARRRPEVMVKVTGSARGLRGIKEYLAYITRNGKLVGERENGERIEGAREVREVAEEWWADGVGRRKRTRDTINLILSMPPGTDQNAVVEAASAFAQKAFGGDYDYLLAHHTRDADPKRPENPHAHLTVKRRGRHGQSLNPRKADLQAWREAFAAELRQRGVVAEATPRRMRGVVRKGQRQAIRHMDARQATRVTKWKLTQAVLTASKGNDGATEAWAQAAKERQRKVRRAWNTLAAAFEQAGQPKLAQEIKQFVSTMPSAQTERERFIGLANELLARQQVKDRVKDRGRSR